MSSPNWSNLEHLEQLRVLGETWSNSEHLEQHRTPSKKKLHHRVRFLQSVGMLRHLLMDVAPCEELVPSLGHNEGTCMKRKDLMPKVKMLHHKRWSCAKRKDLVPWGMKLRHEGWWCAISVLDVPWWATYSTKSSMMLKIWWFSRNMPLCVTITDVGALVITILDYSSWCFIICLVDAH